MSLDKSTLERVAYLARIKIDNSEIGLNIFTVGNLIYKFSKFVYDKFFCSF